MNKIDRRDLLRAGLVAGSAMPFAGLRIAPSWLQAAAGSAANKKLVIIQIKGGWDYFNQIVPVNEPIYYQARKTSTVGIADTEGTAVTRISASIPQKWAIAMNPFKTLYDRGWLAVVNNVGYPNPNLSHFESERIWYAADPGNTPPPDGWLARFLKSSGSGFEIPALDLESAQSQAFQGIRVPVVADLASFKFGYDTGTWQDNEVEARTMSQCAMFMRPATNSTLQVIAKTTNEALRAVQSISANGTYQPRVTYPNSELAKNLLTAAKFIVAGLPIPIYYLSTGEFDLHANMSNFGSGHTGRLADLLRTVTQAVQVFLDDMQAQQRGQEVVVFVFSEFSRRFGENGSGGTDHGHGGVCYLAGPSLVGGFYGKYPNLTQATQPYYNWYPPFSATDSIDFRSVYATILERLFQVPSAPILGSQFPVLPV